MNLKKKYIYVKKIKKLNDLNIGESGILIKSRLINSAVGRLIEMGMINGEKVTVIGKVFLSGIMQIIIKDTFYICIEIKEASCFDAQIIYND